VNILYFGRLADAAATSAEEVTPPEGIRSLNALRAWLGRDRPALAAALADGNVRAAVNDEIAPGDRPLASGDEIAFLPPASGG
jgi:molybdopterin synthase sulfur carrier subunit